MFARALCHWPHCIAVKVSFYKTLLPFLSSFTGVRLLLWSESPSHPTYSCFHPLLFFKGISFNTFPAHLILSWCLASWGTWIGAIVFFQFWYWERLTKSDICLSCFIPLPSCIICLSFVPVVFSPWHISMLCLSINTGIWHASTLLRLYLISSVLTIVLSLVSNSLQSLGNYCFWSHANRCFILSMHKLSGLI